MPTFNSMRNKRHIGTAEWCFDTPEYRGWANGNKSAVLHITGKSCAVLQSLANLPPSFSFVSMKAKAFPRQQSFGLVSSNFWHLR
ncbi:hypothetical protein LB505_011206 [Fusarium chuoi]|nr:hypothetical protein LB505_011206 [Fusarium chuoi]